MRILIISFFFPPYDSVAAVRTGKMAAFLSRFGHDVRVLSARDQNVPTATLPVELDARHVTYTPWWGPRRLADLILGRGAMIARGAAETRGGNGQRPRGLARVAAIVKTLVYFPDAQIGWLPFALHAAGNVTADWRPDVILASASPATSLLVAARLSKRLRVPWVADLRDLWVANHAYDQPVWRRGIERRLERSILERAAGLVTVSAPLAETLRAFGPPVAVVPNGFDPIGARDVAPMPARRTVEIVYTGTVYEGYQDPAPLFAALARLGRDADGIRIRFYGAAPALVLPIAERFGVRGCVECVPPVTHLEARRAQEEADALLLLLWNDPTQPGVFTTKIFEYLGARRPIIAIGHPAGVAADLVRERRAGITTNDVDVIEAELRRVLALHANGSRLPDLPADVARGLTREDQARRLETFLADVLGRPHLPQLAGA